MKSRIINLIKLALLPAALFTFASCSSTPTPPPDVGSARIDYTKGVPGGVIVQTFKTTATVATMDKAKRTVTLRGSDGKKFIVKVKPEAISFYQLHAGDQVNATVVQKIVASINPAGTTAGDRSLTVVALAEKRDQPGGLIAESTQVTAKVITIDSIKRTTTLRFEDGTSLILPIRDDVDLSRRKLGEQVVFRVTEMVAISIERL